MFVPCVLLGAGIGIADDRFGDMADLAGNAMIAVDLEASIPALPEEVHILTDDAHPVLFQLEQEEGHEGLLALRLRCDLQLVEDGCFHEAQAETEVRKDRKSTRLTPVTNAHLVCRLLLAKKNI